MQGASTSLEADYKRFAATDALARAFEDKAVQARAEQARLAAKARAAKDRAAAAATEAQATADRIADEKDRLVRELAAAQDISVRLARQRQAALEEIARQRAEERARREAAAAARAAARANARAEAKARREARHRANSGGGTPQPAPAPAPAPGPAPRGSGGAGQAIAFAKAQLGDWYLWGAAGPDRWDCSGLMVGAWGSAGVYLPHYSVAQYEAATPISPADLRPGDLVFWGTTSDPASIHHVAMYIGDGLIIHAPRTGRPVEIDSMYYWIPPNFFARV
jgi:cell wall-associated NlpC family hydrolase